MPKKSSASNNNKKKGKKGRGGDKIDFWIVQFNPDLWIQDSPSERSELYDFILVFDKNFTNVQDCTVSGNRSSHTPPFTSETCEDLKTTIPRGASLCISAELVAVFPLISEALQSQCRVTVKPLVDFPQNVHDWVSDQSIEEPCAMECTDGVLTNLPLVSFPRDTSGQVRCVCGGLMSVENMTEDFMYSLNLAAQMFYVSKAWLHLRMNHLVALSFPADVSVSGEEGEEKCTYYAQVMGGTGQCDVTLLIYDDWKRVQNEYPVRYKTVNNGAIFYQMKVL
jgi:hypothetical protein